MNGGTELLTVAALLERAYRLTLELDDGLPPGVDAGRFIVAELVDVLDEARVALLVASGATRQYRA